MCGLFQCTYVFFYNSNYSIAAVTTVIKNVRVLMRVESVCVSVKMRFREPT